MKFGEILGIGVAGNFAGHLEQAGEFKNLVKMRERTKNAPKGVFPFYIPKSKSFLGVLPFSTSKIIMPKGNIRLQPEPEVVLLCNTTYKNKRLTGLKPIKFAAFNDCSIREDKQKLSEKKNWGPASQGISKNFMSIDRFEPGGLMDNYNIACFLVRKGTTYTYGVDSPVASYTYFYKKLLEWIVERLNNQKDIGLMENMYKLIKVANYPKQALIAIGATAYTSYGNGHFLKRGDVVYVVVYNHKVYTQALIRKLVIREGLVSSNDVLILKQTMV